MNEWLVSSLAFFGIWLAIFLSVPRVRREMLWMSTLSLPLGLTEPIFVPEYWTPPSLFNLATKTGFDIESFIFAFALGGVASVVYEVISGARHRKTRDPHRWPIHLLAIATPLLCFIPLHVLTELNPIYSVIVSAFLGALATILCRNDLAKPMILGGVIFLALYFFSFLAINLTYPHFITAAWNLRELSGILVWGVPLEEMIYALSVGMLLSGVYEHIAQLKLRKN